MRPPPTPVAPPAPSITPSDIYYVLFRHKWKIIVCGIVGFVAAGAMYFFNPPPYHSDAKLYIRYVLTEGRNVGPTGFDAAAKSPDRSGETIMTSEIEILTSFDLAKQVAETVGPAKIVGDDAKDLPAGVDVAAAATVISRGLTVTAPLKSSIIYISFRHKDPQVVQPVLRELIDRYLKMHGQVHRSKGMLGDFLVQETDQLRSRLTQTEEDLRKARNKAGVVSIEDAKHSVANQMASVQQQIHTVQAELAARTSVLQELGKHRSDAQAEIALANAEAMPPAEKIDAYRAVTAQFLQMQSALQQLLIQFTPENPRVKELKQQLAATEAQKRALEVEYPRLLQAMIATSTPTVGSTPLNAAIDPALAAIEIVSYQAKLKVLMTQLEELRTEGTKLDQVESEMAELRRKKELDEANYKLFAASLERSRIAEAMGDGRVSNISQIQTPSQPIADLSTMGTIAGGIAFAGLALGLAWAFAIEFYLDRSIRRAKDVERGLRLPLFLSIPKLRGKAVNGRAKGKPKTAEAPAGSAETATDTQLALQTEHRPLDVFHETLRDRLISFFESRGLVHKPKLVAVTGLAHGAGVTTTAAGLARSLSETGEGNVLLVDMTAGQGSSQHFMKGKAVCGIDELLDSRQNAHVDQNLYVVVESSNSERLSRNLPQRFTKLVPKLKASDFDYIVFDMPVINQISITPRMAGFMDMVLLVVESEKTDREIAQQAADLIAQSKSNIGVVLNKATNYVPRMLQSDLLTSA